MALRAKVGVGSIGLDGHRSGQRSLRWSASTFRRFNTVWCQCNLHLDTLTHIRISLPYAPTATLAVSGRGLFVGNISTTPLLG